MALKKQTKETKAAEVKAAAETKEEQKTCGKERNQNRSCSSVW